MSQRSSHHHALVIGASLAGLLAARVLSSHFARVTVLERDELADAPDEDPRKGVPQGRHAHGLLAQGRVVLEHYFPGLSEAVVARGGQLGDVMNDVSWYGHGVRLAQQASPLVGLLTNRPLLESCIREKLLATRPNVTLRAACGVRSLTHGERRVTGVVCTASETIAADLVVDCSGRGSRSPQWLHEMGWPQVPEERVEVGIGYTTRLFRRRPGDLGGKTAVVVAGSPPNWRNGAMLYHGPDRWIVSVGGYFGDCAPTDEAGFAAYCASLPTPDIHQIVARGEPVSDFASYRFPANVRHRYDRLPPLPAGYLPFGDALCSFNPVYGQGMTVAAQEALLLDEALAHPDAATLAGRFLLAANQGPIDTAWSMAAGNDLRHPGVQGAKPLAARAIDAYVGALYRAGAQDAKLATAFLEVANLMRSPAALLHPALALRVLKARLLGRSADESLPFQSAPGMAPLK